MDMQQVIKLAEQAGYCAESDTLPPFYPWLQRFAALVAQQEREACAKVCETEAKAVFDGCCSHTADALNIAPAQSAPAPTQP